MDCNENNRWKIIIKKCINSDKKYCEIKKGNEFYKQMIRFINELDCITYKKNKDHKKYKNKVNILYQFLKLTFFNNYIKKRSNITKIINIIHITMSIKM